MLRLVMYGVGMTLIALAIEGAVRGYYWWQWVTT